MHLSPTSKLGYLSFKATQTSRTPTGCMEEDFSQTPDYLASLFGIAADT